MVVWNTKLYMDEKAKKSKASFKKRFEKKTVRGAYCIALSQDKNQGLEIYYSKTKWYQYYRKTGIHIVGICKDYDSALELLQKMVLDILNQYGELSKEKIREYFS